MFLDDSLPPQELKEGDYYFADTNDGDFIVGKILSIDNKTGMFEREAILCTWNNFDNDIGPRKIFSCDIEEYKNSAIKYMIKLSSEYDKQWAHIYSRDWKYIHPDFETKIKMFKTLKPGALYIQSGKNQYQIVEVVENLLGYSYINVDIKPFKSWGFSYSQKPFFPDNSYEIFDENYILNHPKFKFHTHIKQQYPHLFQKIETKKQDPETQPENVVNNNVTFTDLCLGTVVGAALLKSNSALKFLNGK